MSKLLENKVALLKMEPVIRADLEEMHRSGRAGWLRAAVLGSDDAIGRILGVSVG